MRRVAVISASLLLGTGAPAFAQAPPGGANDEKLQKQLDAQQADLEEQSARIRDLEKQLKSLLAKQREAAQPPGAAPPLGAPTPPPNPDAPPPPPPGAEGASLDQRIRRLMPEFLRDLSMTAYIQAQYEAHQDAQDQLDPSGQPLNTDRFLLRRARVKIEKAFTYASTMVEVDGNTVNGPSFGLLHAEASVMYRGERAFSLPPFIQVTLGLFDTPFGYELVESPRARFFTERSLASRAFFPGEPDLGGRITSALGWFRASVAILNGNPLGEKTSFPLRDPAAVKDIAARVGAEVEPTPWLFVAGGASVYNGKGFHPGAVAGKPSVQWKDANEDGIIEQTELLGIPATTSTPSQTFDRWIVGADLRLMFRTPIGPTRLGFEVMVANNMDRGLFIADPILTGVDNREIGVMAGFTQEILGYGVLGFRFDSYDPNADAQTRQGGVLLPTSQTVRTYSPLIGLMLPSGLADLGATPTAGVARLLFQYDVNRNQLGRDARGVPTNLASDTWTLRLQGSL
jgi:hypothetical protein